MRSVVKDTLFVTVQHLHCYIITPPLHGGHMNMDKYVTQRPLPDSLHNMCVRSSMTGVCLYTRGPRRTSRDPQKMRNG